MNKMMQTKKGFTLSETLVAIAIMGVIAAATIPTIINATNKHEYVNGLKRATLLLKTATAELILNNGGTMLYISSPITNDGLLNLYCTKLNCIKKCPQGSPLGECWTANDRALNPLAAFTFTVLYQLRSRAILANGMTIIIPPANPLCTANTVVINGQNLGCSMILIDVNGFKPPNRAGRDVYIFILYTQGIVPFGSSITPTVNNWDLYCNPDLVGPLSGTGCAGRVLTEGAMNY